MILGTQRNLPPGTTPIPGTTGMGLRENAALVQQGQDTTKLHLIVDMTRCGAQLFNTRLEYTHFAPRSGKNHLFQMVLLKWPAENPLHWCITSIPIEYRAQAEQIAKECGLRFADGIPMIFAAENQVIHFPMNGPTVYTLENTKEHQVYRNDPALYKKMKDQEYEQVDEIFKKDKEKLYAEFRSKGYSDAQIGRILKVWETGDESYDEIPENPVAEDGQHRHG